MVKIWIALKLFASFIEVDSECVTLYQRRRPEAMGVYVKNLNQITTQLCGDQAGVIPALYTEISNFVRLGHCLYIRVPFNCIYKIFQISEDKDRNLILIWENTDD